MIWLPNELKDLLLMEHFPLRSGSEDSLRDLVRHGDAAERNGSVKDSKARAGALPRICCPRAGPLALISFSYHLWEGRTGFVFFRTV